MHEVKIKFCNEDEDEEIRGLELSTVPRENDWITINGKIYRVPPVTWNLHDFPPTVTVNVKSWQHAAGSSTSKERI